MQLHNETCHPPRSCLDNPSIFLRRFSTTLCVAMPAWSTPGTHRVTLPLMRCQRVSVSWMALVRACPRCSEPVTLGGGITITNRPSSPASLAAQIQYLSTMNEYSLGFRLTQMHASQGSSHDQFSSHERILRQQQLNIIKNH